MNESVNSIVDLKNKLDIKKNNLNAFITKKNKKESSTVILEKSLMYYNYESNNIASCNQVHSNKVQFIKKSGIYQNTDGLVCAFDSKLILLIQTADCVPIFILDDIKGLMGLVHSGWRGTYKNIIKSALSIFFDRGSKKNNIKIYLGPSIKQCCYEIKEDVFKYFDKKYIIVKENSSYLNLIDKIQDDILLEGIDEHNVCSSKVCTFEDKNYYSYRRGDNGRIYSAIGLEK